MLIPSSSKVIIRDLVYNDHLDINDIATASKVGVATLYYVLQGRSPSARTEHSLLSYYIQRKLGMNAHSNTSQLRTH